MSPVQMLEAHSSGPAVDRCCITCGVIRAVREPACPQCGQTRFVEAEIPASCPEQGG